MLEAPAQAISLHEVQQGTLSAAALCIVLAHNKWWLAWHRAVPCLSLADLIWSL